MSFLPDNWLAQVSANSADALGAIFPVVALIAGICLGAAVIHFLIGLLRPDKREQEVKEMLDPRWEEIEDEINL